jgi:TDG/mug DNA glycosylase family protein
MPRQVVPDVIGPDVRVLFCGINPGLKSAELGQHFARPGNRFWKALHGAGFTPDVLRPDQQHELPALGVGIVNLVDRATAAASELTSEELAAGAARLERKVAALRPRAVAFLGVQAYRTAFRERKAQLGRQVRTMGDSASPTQVWVLANPSGLQARYQLPELVAMFAEVRSAVTDPDPGSATTSPPAPVADSPAG